MRRSLLNSSTTSIDPDVRCLDFIAQGPVSKADYESLTFKEHTNRTGCYVYELNDPLTKGVRLLATDEPEPDTDFCVAFFNRKTRRTIVKPATFLQIGCRQADDADIARFMDGQRKKRRANFDLDNSIANEEKAKINHNLTAEFGNNRRKRFLEAALRRKVTDDSKTMTDSSLDTSGLEPDSSFSSIGSPISEKPVVAEAESYVLPPLNLNAKDPTEIIDLKKLFRDDDEDFFLEEGKKFFAEADTVQKMGEYDIPPVVANIIVRNCKKSSCTAACMLLALLSKMLRNINNNVFRRVFDFGQACYARVASKYIKNATLLENHNTRIASSDKARIQAYTFALMLELSENYVLPISPLAQELKIGEFAATKLLQSMGCLVHDPTPEQMVALNTTKVARLVGSIFGTPGGRKLRKRR